MRSRRRAGHGAETRLIRLSELKFRACEGYYSKSAHACTWPCSITQMDAKDQMDQVYEALVHWADAVIVASPIRWGAASSLYFKMAERLNCVQNAITIRNQVLIRNKVAGFIIVGGQDNIQGVAGQMLGFFAELGFIFPQFPYIAHSRGWSSEDMERNVEIVRNSAELAEGAAMLAKRCLDLAAHLIARDEAPTSIERGGRKAHTLEMEQTTRNAADRVAAAHGHDPSRIACVVAELIEHPPAAATTRSTMAWPCSTDRRGASPITPVSAIRDRRCATASSPPDRGSARGPRRHPAAISARRCARGAPDPAPAPASPTSRPCRRGFPARLRPPPDSSARRDAARRG